MAGTCKAWTRGWLEVHVIPATNCCLQGGIEDYDYPHDIPTSVNEECSGLVTDSGSTTLLRDTVPYVRLLVH